MVARFSLPTLSLALLFLVNGILRSPAQFNYVKGDTVYCIKPDGLPLYDQLDRGNVLQRLRYGKRMVVIDKYAEDTFDNIRDHWYKVQTDSTVGYVFGGYLWFMPAPPPTGNIELYLRRYIPKPQVISRTQLTCNEAPPERCYREELEFTWKGRKILLTTELGDMESRYEAIQFPGLDPMHLLVFVKAAYRNVIEQLVSGILSNPHQPDKEKREEAARAFRRSFDEVSFTNLDGRRLHLMPNIYSLIGLESMALEDLGGGRYLFEYLVMKGF